MAPTLTSDLPSTPGVSQTGAAPVLSAVPGSPRRSRDKRRAWLRGLRHVVVGVVLLSALGAAVLALRPRPVPVDVGQARHGALVVAIEEPGVTRVKDRYTVSAPVTGHVSRVSLEAGDGVHDGDSLAEIAPALSPLLDERTRAEAEARLGAAVSALGQARSLGARARVARELADQELNRTKSLAAAGSLPQHALEQAEFGARMRAEEETSAEFAAKVAAEEVRLSRVALGRDGQSSTRDRHLDVLAPVSGRVLRVHQKSAGVVQAGTPIVEIGDPRALEVVVDVLTTDAVQVKPGTAVVIQGWGGDVPLAGKVRRVEPSAFTRPSALGVDEQRVNVIVALTDAPERWSALGDGYRVEARLVLWGGNVLCVPQGAVFRYGDGWAVYELRGGTAALTAVKVGHRGDTEVEIVSGLSPGATVAVHPGDRVKHGVRVEPR